MRRWAFFSLCILIGIAIGLIYGNVVQPIKYTNTTLTTLRMDYKTDYVLMVAESYEFLKDPAAAVQQLTALEGASPLETVRQAIMFAEQAGYNNLDLKRLRSLQSALGGEIRPSPTKSP